MKLLKNTIVIITLLVINILLTVYSTKNENYKTVDNINKEHQFNNPDYNTESIKKINTISLKNKNIKNKYQFVYFSDLHLSAVNEDEKNEKIKKSLYDRNKEFYSDEDSSIAKIRFEEIVNYTNRKKANALLMGGDIIDSPAKSNIDIFRKNIRNLKTDYLYTFGNHDWSYLWDYHTDETKQKYISKFNEFMHDSDVDYLEYEDLVVLAINSSTDQIEEQSLNKIKGVLEKNKPTIVMMHVPISTPKIAEDSLKLRARVSATGDGGIKPTEATQKAFDLILSDKYKVFYILSGHVHIKMEDDLNNTVHEFISDAAFNGEINLIKINN